jgi:hypothetical protein
MISFPSKRLEPGTFVIMCGWGSMSYPDQEFPNYIQYAVTKVEDCSHFQNTFVFEIQQDQICTFENNVGACIVS